MQNRFDLLVADVMPIYMIIPRYSHNYAQFYQFLDSNSFTHRNTYALERSHEWNLWPPGLFSIILIFQHLAIFIAVYFTLHLYHKNTKNIILSYLSDLTLVSDREEIDNPFIALVARFLFVCVGAWDLCVISYWIDTLVHKNWGKYLHYFTASHFPLQGKTNAVLKR